MKTLLFDKNTPVEGMHVHIDASAFVLPTNGADVVCTEWIVKKDTNYQWCKVRGEIHPVDPTAEPICFQVNLPAVWNEKVIQYGGGVFDGIVNEATKVFVGQSVNTVAPHERGYVTFGCDGGHTADLTISWDSRFALNQESLLNFAYQSGKKTFDAVMAIIAHFYGTEPKRVYMVGWSNGGREVLKAIQLYPEDYDGVICFYPVLNWIGKALLDNRNANLLTRNTDLWMDSVSYRKFYHKLLEVCDELDGEKDSVIANLSAAEGEKAQILDSISEVLPPEQIKGLELFANSLTLPYSLANGINTVPGYGIFLGADIQAEAVGQFGTKGNRDGVMAQFADAVIRYQIMQNEAFDPADFDYVRYQTQVQHASELLDATNPDLDRFFAHGGKMIFLHGTADQVVTMYSSLEYYKSLKLRYPEEILEECLRFYIAPGYGHGMGNYFTIGGNFLETLEAWVEGKGKPETLEVIDETPDHEHRVRNLRRYEENAILLTK